MTQTPELLPIAHAKKGDCQPYCVVIANESKLAFIRNQNFKMKMPAASVGRAAHLVGLE